MLTSSVSALCFGSSFIGSGALWGWLQNIVGVSNQVCLSALNTRIPSMNGIENFADCLVIHWTCKLAVSQSMVGTGPFVR